MKMPLFVDQPVVSPTSWLAIAGAMRQLGNGCSPFSKTYHAAPTTERPMQSAIPRSAQAYGDTDSRKAPTYSDSMGVRG